MHCLWRPEDGLDLLEPEFQEVVDHLTWVSEMEFWFSARAGSTENLWALPHLSYLLLVADLSHSGNIKTLK